MGAAAEKAAAAAAKKAAEEAAAAKKAAARKAALEKEEETLALDLENSGLPKLDAEFEAFTDFPLADLKLTGELKPLPGMDDEAAFNDAASSCDKKLMDCIMKPPHNAWKCSEKIKCSAELAEEPASKAASIDIYAGMTGYLMKCEKLTGSWDKSIKTASVPAAVVAVETKKGDCKTYCAKQGRKCVRAQDTHGKCDLEDRHTRQTTAENGCLQKWHDQICACSI